MLNLDTLKQRIIYKKILMRTNYATQILNVKYKQRVFLKYMKQ